MSGPTFEEMEHKRQEMIASFKDIAAAMTRCVQIIEDYTRVAPGSISNPSLTNIDSALVNLPTTLSAFANAQSAIPSIPVQPSADDKKKPKKEKKPRDPDAPKRPPSAYILFQNDVREKIRQENPGMAYKDILAVISEQWKNLPDTSKKDYDTAYQLAQSAYRQNDDAYKAGKIISALPVPEEEESSESESSGDSESESEPAPQTFNHTSITPALLSAAVHSTPVESGKKEKKRKAKDIPAPAAVTPVAEGEKKKKKKKDQACN